MWRCVWTCVGHKCVCGDVWGLICEGVVCRGRCKGGDVPRCPSQRQCASATRQTPDCSLNRAWLECSRRAILSVSLAECAACQWSVGAFLNCSANVRCNHYALEIGCHWHVVVWSHHLNRVQVRTQIWESNLGLRFWFGLSTSVGVRGWDWSWGEGSGLLLG